MKSITKKLLKGTAVAAAVVTVAVALYHRYLDDAYQYIPEADDFESDDADFATATESDTQEADSPTDDDFETAVDDTEPDSDENVCE